MKKSGKCPKCSSSAIFKDRRVLGHRKVLPIGFFSWKAARLEDFVCTDCGYVESYVFDSKARDKIRAKWEAHRA